MVAKKKLTPAEKERERVEAKIAQLNLFRKKVTYNFFEKTKKKRISWSQFRTIITKAMDETGLTGDDPAYQREIDGLMHSGEIDMYRITNFHPDQIADTAPPNPIEPAVKKLD